MWDSLAAAWLIDPGFVTKSEIALPGRADGLGQVLRLDGAAGPARGARRHAGDGDAGLDFKRVFALYKDRLTRVD